MRQVEVEVVFSVGELGGWHHSGIALSIGLPDEDIHHAMDDIRPTAHYTRTSSKQFDTV